jgi:predicted dehydrogenase
MAPHATRRQWLTSAFAAALFPAGSHSAPRLAFAEDAPHASAAEAAGFETVAARFEDALADRSIHAVCIAAPVFERAHMAAEACRAGKDVWVEAPVCASLEEGRRMVRAARRYGRVVQAGTVWRSSRAVQAARRAIHAGELGDIVYCRAFEGTASANRAHLVDLLQFVFDEAAPLSVAAQGSGGNLLATYRYPRFVASYESRGTGPAGIAFHGVTATRIVDLREDGARVAHWRNFLECTGSRRRPVADIETGVRSTMTQSLEDLALRRGTSIASIPFEMETNLA